MYKINLHILEPCNLNCKHCFSHFGSSKILPVGNWKQIVDNCISSGLVSGFNIAGGEPLLYPDLEFLIEYIKSKGMYCSIITNGTLVTPDWIKKNARNLDAIGFSVDSFEPDTIRAIGRITSRGEYLSVMRMRNLYLKIKQNNPKCEIKINTVVSTLNKDENIAEAMKDLFIVPNKWKILKMREFKNNAFSNLDISVSEKEYEEYAERNLSFFGIERKEEEGSEVYTTSDNMKIVIEKELSSGYLIIDSNGCLIDNSTEGTHTVIANCLDTSFSSAFQKLNFNSSLYSSRYTSLS